MTRRTALAWAEVVLYAALIFALSAQSHPLQFLPPVVWGHDKLLHMAEYAVLGGLIARALRLGGRRPAQVLVLALLAASLYGASDELHQRFVPDRTADPRDWAADTAGAALGAAAVTFLRRRGGGD